MKNAETIPMIFLPGLNGDPRVFQPQIAAYPQIHIAEWLELIEREGIRGYAKPLAAATELQIQSVILSESELAAVEGSG
jgi:hypothetical protein